PLYRHDTSPTYIYTLSLHDALPIFNLRRNVGDVREQVTGSSRNGYEDPRGWNALQEPQPGEVEQIQKQIASELNGPKRVKRRSQDRKSTRLNSSHRTISYAVFCLKK